MRLTWARSRPQRHDRPRDGATQERVTAQGGGGADTRGGVGWSGERDNLTRPPRQSKWAAVRW
eukprot:10292749-Lingulodinium_polyedra.AAC.1